MADADQHVLVVDDEAQIRQFVRAGMELGGYRVTEAANGSDALREITLHPIDLVILELALPDIDGSELLERIRGWTGVPVIILSVRAGETEKVKLLELGADELHLARLALAQRVGHLVLVELVTGVGVGRLLAVGDPPHRLPLPLELALHGGATGRFGVNVVGAAGKRQC